MAEVISKVNYEDEMKQSFIDYAMSVIVDRALPDVRDGLKPVQRRIMYGMYELGVTSDKPHKKSARIVGDVMGKYHPHGDSSIYEAMVRLSQDFQLNMPLVDGHGNFGSIDGDGAAAMRYTEARLSPIASLLLDDLSYKVVDYRPNYDNSLEEPEILPAKLPHLLLNGATGIAVGMSTNIPPHNLREIINASILLLENPNASTKRLMSKIKAPDYPTGGIIINQDDLLSLYETGEGRVKIRGKVEIEPASHGKTNIVITEIPYSYSGNKTKFIQIFIDLVKDKKLEEISDVRDESDRNGIRIILEVRKGVNIENLLNKLYKRTPLEDSITYKMIAIVDGVPKLLSLKEILEHYIAFQKEITVKKYKYLLKRSEERLEILEGLIKATDVIDTIIEMLRGSKSVKQAKLCLTKGDITGINFRTKKAQKKAETFKFTEIQANAILDMKLQRLIQLEVNQLEKDFEELKKQINKYQGIVSDEQFLVEEIKSYLKDMGSKYGEKRKTEITNEEEVEYVEEVNEEEIYIIIDNMGYVKAVDYSSINRANEETLNEYTIIPILNTEKLFCFTDTGRFLQINSSDIPLLKMRDKGTPIDVILPLQNEKVISFLSEKECLQQELLFVTKEGLVKIVEGKEFKTTRIAILATKLNESDQLFKVTPLKEEKFITCVSSEKKALKFLLKEIPKQKRTTKGVKSMNLSSTEHLLEFYLSSDEKDKIKINSINAQVKDIPLGKRAGKSIQYK